MHNADEILEIAREVLDIEINNLQSMRDTLNGEFVRLVHICMNCVGKVIITGMGKSGHVGRKISATLASLGTPSFFLHPAEAAHGDLGMVQKEDVVIMISNSGETDELIQLLPSFHKIGCRLVGLLCHENSTIGKYCECEFVIHVAREACSNNLAPTSSTTSVLACGDALAVTISRLKSFKKQDFALLHPKGILGRRLLTTAKDLGHLSYEDVVVNEMTPIKEVLFTITKNHLGAVAVSDEEGRLKGVITDGDIRRRLDDNYSVFNYIARDIMTCNPITVAEDMLAVDVFNIMQKKKVSVVPLIDGNKYVKGMISLHDIIGAGIVG